MTIIKTYPSAYEYVLAFHEIFGATIASEPTIHVSEQDKNLRIRLLEEELKEYAVAWGEADIIEMADALGDFVYVAYGAGITYGVDIDKALATTPRQAFHNRHLYTSFGVPVSDHSDGVALFVALASALVRYIAAVDGDSSDEVAEALADCVDAAYHTAEVFGIALDPVLEEIQRSNLSKLGADGKPVISRGMELDGKPVGKVLKGPNFFEPDIAAVLARQEA